MHITGGTRVRLLNVLTSSLAAIGLVAAACSPAAPAAPTAAPAGAPLAAASAASTSTECEPGKEHWRATTPPKRGGTIVRATTVENFDPTRATGAGEPAPQIY